MLYLVNAVSINMLPRKGRELAFRPITADAARNLLDNHESVCAIGHEDTANIVGGILGLRIEAARVNVELRPMQDSLLVAQYRGPRLEAGTTELPAGATLEFWSVYDYV